VCIGIIIIIIIIMCSVVHVERIIIIFCWIGFKAFSNNTHGRLYKINWVESR